jgi:histidine triad (HIT) family protein
MDCLFCKIIEGKIPAVKVYEDERFLAFLDINPVNPGHTLVIPKSHQDEVFAMDEEEYTALFRTARELANAVKKAMGSKRVGIIVEGFLIPHAHVHLVPINAGNELHHQNMDRASRDELEGTAEKIRQEIKRSI